MTDEKLNPIGLVMTDVLNDEELGHLKVKDLRRILLHMQNTVIEEFTEEEDTEDENVYKYIL